MEIPVARKYITGLAFDTEVIVASGTPERSVHVQLALSEVYLPDLRVFSVPITLVLTVIASMIDTD